MPPFEPQTLPCPTSDGTDESRPPAIAYWSMFRDEEGKSALAQVWLEGFVKEALGGLALPLWMRTFKGRPSAVKFFVLPVGWTGDWHESPRPQWVVPLSGRWYIETASGHRLEMGPGEIHWGEDVRTADGRGHRSGQIGEHPCVQLIIQFEMSESRGGADPFAVQASPFAV
jgi:hypothetical protein